MYQYQAQNYNGQRQDKSPRHSVSRTAFSVDTMMLHEIQIPVCISPHQPLYFCEYWRMTINDSLGGGWVE